MADANAILGIEYEHTPASEAVPSDAVVQSSTTNSLGGTTTVAMIPEPTLPLVQPLVNAGVPASITGPLNKALTPIVEAGYSQYTPKAGPYVSGGKLVGLNVQTHRPRQEAIGLRISGHQLTCGAAEYSAGLMVPGGVEC